MAELDRWLERDLRGDDRGTLRRARDEIVALRERRYDIRRVVLEEAALACERIPGDDEAAYRLCAKIIRALKDDP